MPGDSPLFRRRPLRAAFFYGAYTSRTTYRPHICPPNSAFILLPTSLILPAVILVFLHGAPATGKYTVGRELAALTGFELYHNHLVVDDVLTRHAFGTPGFVAERDHAWRQHLAAAAADANRRLIFTFNPENSVPQAFIDWLFQVVPAQGGRLHSIGLRLGEEGIEARLASEQRRGFRKLTDLALYRKLRREGVFNTPHIPRTDLLIDGEHLSARDAATRIAQHFKLTR